MYASTVQNSVGSQNLSFEEVPYFLRIIRILCYGLKLVCLVQVTPDVPSACGVKSAIDGPLAALMGADCSIQIPSSSAVLRRDPQTTPQLSA